MIPTPGPEERRQMERLVKARAGLGMVAPRKVPDGLAMIRRQVLADDEEPLEPGQRREHAGGWTDERVELLTALWNEGKSCREIASVLGQGATRNCVIGKAHRLGLVNRKPVPAKSIRARKQPSQRKRVPKYTLPPSVPHTPIPDPRPPLIALTDLTDETCRFPVGDPKVSGFGFCGLPPEPGKPYCAEHERLTHSPVTKKAARQAKVSTTFAKERWAVF